VEVHRLHLASINASVVIFVRLKGYLVAGGHLTDVPLESVYSGVVSVQSLQLVNFLS